MAVTDEVETDPPGIEDLRAGMLQKKFWIIKTRAVAPRAEIEKLLREHLLSQIRLEKEGVLFAAGPVRDLNGKVEYGMFILRAESEAEARRIADSDPLHKAGLREYTLHTWSMNEGRIRLAVDVSDGRFSLE